MLFTAPDVATMMRWIEEGRLHPDDSVSRTGRNWLRLGDMAEFAHLFGPDVAEPVFRPIDGKSEISALEEVGPPPDFGGGSALEDPVPAPVDRTHTLPMATGALLAEGPKSRPDSRPRAQSSSSDASVTSGSISVAPLPKAPSSLPPAPAPVSRPSDSGPGFNASPAPE